jgi:hypothetical protein
LKTQDYTDVSDIEIIARAVYKQSGRLKQDQKPDIYKIERESYRKKEALKSNQEIGQSN